MIDFPVGTTIGQEFYSDTNKYTWDGVKWKVSQTQDWIRPTDWLTLPTVLETEEKFVGLYAIFPHNDGIENSMNYIAYVSSNGSTVDWGDGSPIETAIGNVNLYHIYDYNNLSPTTLCSRGYKQVIVTITGPFLSGLNIAVKHYLSPSNQIVPWLDINVSIPNGYIVFSGSGSTMLMVERINIVNNFFAYPWGLSYYFYNMPQLQVVSSFKTANVVTMEYMFAGCSRLKTVPILDTSNVTNMGNMFASCYLLTAIPLYNTSKVTNMYYMLAATAITSCPQLDTSKVTNMSNMFNSCLSLIELPSFNTPLCTAFDGFCRNNISLLKIGALDTSKCTYFGLMLYNCPSLLDIPSLDLFKMITSNQFLDASRSIRSSGVFNIKVSINYNNLNFKAPALTTTFNNLSSLSTIPVIFTDTGDLINAVAHGFVNTIPIRFTSIINTTGISVGTNYFVVNANTNSFQVAATSGGVALPLTTDGTGLCCYNSTITINNNIGAPPVISYTTCNTAAGNTSIIVTTSTTGVTFSTSNTVNYTNHPFKINDKIIFKTITTTTGITVDTPYYVVVTSSPSTFKLALTANGTSISFTTGTGTMLLVILGSQVTGNGSPITTPIAIAFTGSKIVLANHQLLANDIVSFPTITTTTGLVTYTPYYITGTVNSGDFQIATNSGGTPLTFADGTGTMLYDSTLVSISGTASPFTFIMSRPMTATTVANTMAFRTLKTSIALMKNWIVTG